MPTHFSSPRFLQLAFYITKSHSERSFRAHFGGPSIAVEILYHRIVYACSPLPKGWGLHQLLLTLFYLKCGGTHDLISSRFHISWDTFEKWLWVTLVLIDTSLPNVFIYFYLYQIKFLF